MRPDRTDTNQSSPTLLHFDSRPVISVLLTCLIMAAMVCLVFFLKIPNPNMILIAGLVVCSATFGYPGGVTAGVFMFVYTLFFFSTDNDFVTFTDQNLQKVFVSLIGILVDLFFVCHLKRVETETFRQLKQANAMLQEDNHLLEQASQTDQLTGLGNRFALRRDYDSFIDRSVIVFLIDLDDFKAVNDSCGHDAGDQCLRETGRRLRARFPEDSVYRFGGDEFLIICTDQEPDVFLSKAEAFIHEAPDIPLGEERSVPLHYSGGYVYGVCKYDDDLRHMFKQADGQLYESKRAGKNRIQGRDYIY